MFLHGSKDPQVSLKPFVVVIINVCPDHLNKSFPAGKLSAVVALPFQNSPKSFHRAVINTLGNSRHALGDTRLRQFSVKCPACVLKSPITVEEWTSASILPYGSVQCRKDEFIGVSVSDLICYDASVVEVNNGTEIDFVYDDVVFFSFCPLELSHVGQPFLVGSFGMKFAVKEVLCNVLRASGQACAAVICVLDGGFDVQSTADAQHSFVVDTNVMVSFEFVSDTTIPFVRTGGVNLLYDPGNLLILLCPRALFSSQPFVVSGTGDFEEHAAEFHGMTVFDDALSDGGIEMIQSCLRKAFPLSSSFNFFSRSRSTVLS